MTVVALPAAILPRIGELVGNDDLVTAARTYTHAVADARELDSALLTSL